MNHKKSMIPMKKPSHWQIIEPIKKDIYVAMAIAVFSIFCSLLAMLFLAKIVQSFIDTASISWGWFAFSSVRFELVDFRYANRDENALTNVSFYAPEGSFTALMGSSGAGKSTVARLIPRFWDSQKGRVKVGDADVREIAPELLMQQVAFVSQDNFLFSGTIASNIKLGQDDKNRQDIIAAAKAAQAHDFIQSLPDGYDTTVGERGESLSSGQRQRITTARAILQNRPILVLDEATAFADENSWQLSRATEQSVYFTPKLFGKTRRIGNAVERLSTSTRLDAYHLGYPHE